MKTILLGAAALSLLAAPAFAADQTVTIGGTVASQCGLGNQSGGGTGGYTSSVNFANIVDPATGLLDTNASATIGFGNVWCNGPSTLSLAATPFVTGTTVTDTSSFTNALDLVVDGGTNANRSIMVYLGARQVRTGSPATRDLTNAFETGVNDFQSARVRLALPTGTVGNDRPVAGTYAGSVTLTVTAR